MTGGNDYRKSNTTFGCLNCGRPNAVDVKTNLCELCKWGELQNEMSDPDYEIITPQKDLKVRTNRKPN